MLNYTNRFVIEEIIDGSTFIGELDLGVDTKVRKKIKLINVKCHTLSVEQGVKSRDFASELLKDKDIVVTTFKDKYRKWACILAVMYIKDNGKYINVNDLVLKENFNG